ncbi:integration host factor subunit beta [Thiotrichales bacterium 19X7-9]|nr:integration host factor subunit beta [Thiotrichales bacterium 19X7-9]
MSRDVISKSKIIKNLSRSLHIDHQKSDMAVKTILNLMSHALKNNRRIEIRGFGVLEVREHKNKSVRNPKTGEILSNVSAHKIHFKPGKYLKESVINIK